MFHKMCLDFIFGPKKYSSCFWTCQHTVSIKKWGEGGLAVNKIFPSRYIHLDVTICEHFKSFFTMNNKNRVLDSKESFLVLIFFSLEYLWCFPPHHRDNRFSFAFLKNRQKGGVQLHGEGGGRVPLDKTLLHKWNCVITYMRKSLIQNRTPLLNPSMKPTALQDSDPFIEPIVPSLIVSHWWEIWIHRVNKMSSQMISNGAVTL